MPRRKLTIDLPQPCDESWEEMQPVPGGRHCESCMKTVVDLSNYTDAQLMDFFSRKSSTGACCRLRDDQLNRTMQEPPERSLRTVIAQRAAALLLAAQVLVMESVAQTTKNVHQTARPAGKTQKPAQRYLNGRVEGFAPHPGGWTYGPISVQVGDSGTVQVTPDSNFRFRIPLPPGFKDDFVRWYMQEIAGGFILDEIVEVDAKVLASGIALQWQAPKFLPEVDVVRTRYTRSLGGAPIPRFEHEARMKKSSRFTRLFNRRKKSGE